MITIKARHETPIVIGFEGENKAHRVEFDISDFVANYGVGVAQLIFQRPKDMTPYPCVVTQEGNVVLWEITTVETAQSGDFGQCELSYFVDDQLVKSETWQVVVKDAMGEPTEEVPEATQGYMEQILSAGASALASCKSATESEINAKKSEEASAISEQNSKESEKIATRAAEQASELAREVGVNGGIQADWSQNDPNKAGYVHGRTHWEAFEYNEEIIPETSGEGTTCRIDTPFELVKSDMYLVTYNGVEYECKCLSMIDAGKTYPVLSIRNVFSLKPDKTTGVSTGVFNARDGATSVTFSIKHSNKVIHPLDHKFLGLISPNGTKFSLAVADDGTLSATPLVE